MTATEPSERRVRVEGKCFRVGGRKFFAKGVSYGTFAPNAQGEPFPPPAQVRQDFALMRALGANVIRVYALPPSWLFELAAEQQFKLLVDVPWHTRACFLETAAAREQARSAVRRAAAWCAGRSEVFGLSVANEIPPEVVRWSGAAAVADFLDELIGLAKEQDPQLLCTFGNFPPTEFLRPRNTDFHCVNVYLHRRRALENYLARLQMQADHKPLLLGETGLDSVREGAARQAEVLAWQIETACRSGLAGTIVFSFTDDWFKDGRPIADWGFGLTTRQRVPKPAFAAVQAAFAVAPYFPLPRVPAVSVVVACYNGARTLRACLESLSRLHYPDYEVLLVDDGSTDATPAIAAEFPAVRYLRHPRNEGLSVARNTGIQAARGEIVAFTDADCRADEDWLYYLVNDLLRGGFAGVGGPNFLPPEDSPVAAAVLVSPGGPAPVMLTDREAEHVPGCNMAFFKTVLEDLGGFDPIFRKAGDDVDLCWRLQQAGHKIGFSPAGFVWHFRRSTIRGYLKQQQGYGEAEALLARRHPEYFNWQGGSAWRGRIYSPAKGGILTRGPVVYHGTFGSGYFQSVYAAPPSSVLLWFTTLEYHLLVTLPLLVLGGALLGAGLPWVLPIGVGSWLVSLAVCVTAAAQADLPRRQRRFWSRPLIALLYFLQPIVRGFARYQGRLNFYGAPLSAHESLDALSLRRQGRRLRQRAYCAERRVDRIAFLQALLERLKQQGWSFRADAGWSEFDVEIYGGRWCKLQLTTVVEETDPPLLRCRLCTRWTLPSRVVGSALLACEALLLGSAAGAHPWVWLTLLSLPLLGGLLVRQQRHLRRLVAVLLDQVAQTCGLTPAAEAVQAATSASQEAPAQPAAAEAPVAAPKGVSATDS
jgi:glycosyltransferase involved in cell wall biosynthesis